jgi:hypothetical protein
MQTDTRTARRARIQYHSMGTVISRRRARLPGTRPPNISELEEKQHAVLTANSRFVGNSYLIGIMGVSADVKGSQSGRF